MCSEINKDSPRILVVFIIILFSYILSHMCCACNGFIARQSFVILHCIYLCHELNGGYVGGLCSNQRATDLRLGLRGIKNFANIFKKKLNAYSIYLQNMREFG